MTRRVVVVDVETSGLEVERHHIWEGATLEVVDGEVVSRADWWLETDLSTADTNALRLNRYYERLAEEKPALRPRAEVALELAVLLGTGDTHLLGLNPSFDARFIDKLLRENGHAPAHHYHLIDVEALVAGQLGQEAPWSSRELSLAIGVEPPPDGVKHTAAGDRDWVWLMYQAWLARRGGPPAKAAAKKSGGPPVAHPPIVPDRPVATADEAPASADAEPDDSPARTGRPRGMPALDEMHRCEECGTEVDGEQAQKSWTRWRAVLCPDDFQNRRIK